MPDGFPTSKAAWRSAAESNKIGHTQIVTAGIDLVSGSKFKFEHFLRLRVLYSSEEDPKTLAGSPGFPKKRLETLDKILKEDPDVTFLKTFLRRDTDISHRWNVHIAKKTGKFAVALEHLHLIAKRGIREIGVDEDISGPKIVLSPLKTRSFSSTRSDAYEPSSSRTEPRTPTRNPQQSSFASAPPVNDIDDIDLSKMDLSNMTESQEESIPPPSSELRQAKDDYERSDFTPGDEQTVNAALVALIMALSWLLGHHGRVLHDRARFSVSTDAEADLYSADVDGVILHRNGDKYIGFMEVKRNLRGRNRSVRRQIAAQMAAFIYEQDVGLAEKETKKETKKGPQGKGKTSMAKEGKKKDKDGGNQEQ